MKTEYRIYLNISKISLCWICIVGIFLCIATMPSSAESWQRCLGGKGDNLATSIQQTKDGGYIMAGYTTSADANISGGNHGGNDFWVVKLDPSGKPLWQWSLGGSGDDNANSVQQTKDGGYIVAGSTYSNDKDVSGNHGKWDAWIVKISSFSYNGHSFVIPIWKKCFGGSRDDVANSIQQTKDGGYIMAGYTTSTDLNGSGGNHGGTDFWVVKLDPNGNLSWQQSLGGSGNDVANCVQQTKDGGYIVAGYTNSVDVDGYHKYKGPAIRPDDYPNDFLVVKLDPSGNPLWQKCLGGSDDDVANSVQQTSDGGYIVSGSTRSNDGDVSGNHLGISNIPSVDAWVVKLRPDQNGMPSIQWQKCLGGSFYEIANSVQQTKDGGYIVAGSTNSNNDGDVGVTHCNAPNNWNTDFWVVKLDSSGNEKSSKSLGGSGDDVANSIQQTTDGGYIVAGFTDSQDGDVKNNHGNEEAWVVKIDIAADTKNCMINCMGDCLGDYGEFLTGHKPGYPGCKANCIWQCKDTF